MRLIIFVTIFLSPQLCFAFSWDQCKKVFKGSNNLVTSSTASIGSSSSYFSSTGDCALIGVVNHDKKIFIANNLDIIQLDSARGQGEYLSTYANLSGCSKDASRKFANSLQRNMTQVFGAELDNSPEQAYNQIELLISNDPELSVSCKPKT